MSNVELLTEYYNQTADSLLYSARNDIHDDYHDDQVIEGVDGWSDSHLDRHHDQTYYE